MTRSTDQAVSEEISHAFKEWLSCHQYHYNQAGIGQQARLRTLRKTILKAVFSTYQVDRLVELPERDALDLAAALGITVKSPEIAMEMEPRRNIQARPVVVLSETEIEIDGVTYTAENQIRGAEAHAAAERKVCLDPIVAAPYGERSIQLGRIRNRIEQFRLENQAKAQAKAEAEDHADLRDELWTVVAAYHRRNTFILIKQGLMTADWQEAFESQHTEAAMHLEPTRLIGKISDVRAEAAKLFHGISPNDLTIRVILKKKDS